MSGPIIRSGPSEKFTSNWGQAFGGGKAEAAKKTATKAKKKSAPKAKKKSAKKS